LQLDLFEQPARAVFQQPVKLFPGSIEAVRAALFCLLAMAGGPVLLAEAVPDAGLSGGAEVVADASAGILGGMDARVSLDLRSTEVTDAIKYLATKGGLNIAISKNVSGRVNLFLTDVAIRDVFDLILRSNELAYDMQGNVYNVMTEAEYRALYGKKFADLRRVETFRLQYAVPEQAFNLLDTLKSDIGRLLVDEESGTVMVMDTPDNLRQMEQALSMLETESTVRVFDLRYAKAKDVEERLRDEVEEKKLGYVKADERTNQLIIKTLPSRMSEMESLVRALDRKTREVLIDAKIVKVNLTDDLSAGIDWDEVFKKLIFHGIDTRANNFRGSTSGTAPSEVPGVARLGIPELKTGAFLGRSIKPGDLRFGTISRDGYELFRFLQSLGETKVISNPRLLVTENQEARIHVGTREAYVTTTTTTGQTTTTTAEEVEFIDVGIQFLVTPTINQDGYVTMKIKPEISSVIETLTTPSGNEIPIIDTSTAETNVMVMDGRTVVIGGLRKDSRLETDEQVPYLGKVPFLGQLFFKRKTKDNEVAELVVFITPHIIQGDSLVTGDEPSPEALIKPYRDYRSLFPDEAQAPLEGGP
jgi:type IV pilus assembly protein PilQ